MHAEEAHQVGLVAIPVEGFRHPTVAALAAVDHAVGHLLTPEEVAARQVSGRQVQRLDERGRIQHLVEADAAHGDAGGRGVIAFGKLTDGDVESICRVQGTGAVVARHAFVAEAVMQVEQQRPCLVAPAQRHVERLGVVVHILGMQGVAHGGAGVKASDGLAASVEDDHAARGILGVFNGEHVSRARLQPFLPADAIHEVGGFPRDRRQHAAGGSEQRLDMAGTCGAFGENIFRRCLGAVDLVHQRQAAERREFRVGRRCRRRLRCRRDNHRRSGGRRLNVHLFRRDTNFPATNGKQQFSVRFAHNLNFCPGGSGGHAHLLPVHEKGNLDRFAQDAGFLRRLRVGGAGEESQQESDGEFFHRHSVEIRRWKAGNP